MYAGLNIGLEMDLLQTMPGAKVTVPPRPFLWELCVAVSVLVVLYVEPCMTMTSDLC
jgi:hypothetical protein